MLLITPVTAKLCTLNPRIAGALSFRDRDDDEGKLTCSGAVGLLLDFATGVAAEVATEVDESLLEPRDFFCCRRVTAPRIFLISSTSCTPSSGLGFLSLIQRSRWRPREDEVKGLLQKGQALSFFAWYGRADSVSPLLGVSDIAPGRLAATASRSTMRLPEVRKQRPFSTSERRIMGVNCCWLFSSYIRMNMDAEASVSWFAVALAGLHLYQAIQPRFGPQRQDVC